MKRQVAIEGGKANPELVQDADTSSVQDADMQPYQLVFVIAEGKQQTVAIDCIHCSPCTPPFFAVSKHMQ